MSGRIRTIKPELLEDAITAALSDSAFRVFIGMILLADDYGNLRAETRWLEGQIYWSAIPEKSVRESCEELLRPYGESQAVLVTFYKVRGQSYAHINGWSKHQRVQHPGKPRVPGPGERDDGESHETLTNPHETLAPDLRPPTSDHDPEVEAAREGLVPAPAAAPPDLGCSGAQSETRLKSVPPAAPEPAESIAANGANHAGNRDPKPENRTQPELDKYTAPVVAAIRSYPKFREIDAVELAKWAQPLGRLRPPEWLVQAVYEADGELAPTAPEHVKRSTLRRFLQYAKAPREQATAAAAGQRSAAYRESDDPEVLARIRRQPKRVTAQSAQLPPPGAAANAAALIAGIGKGGSLPPIRAPSTDEELEQRRQAAKKWAEEDAKKAGGT